MALNERPQDRSRQLTIVIQGIERNGTSYRLGLQIHNLKQKFMSVRVRGIWKQNVCHFEKKYRPYFFRTLKIHNNFLYELNYFSPKKNIRMEPVNGQTGNILKGSNLYLGQFIFLEKHRHDGQNCHVTSLQF